MGRSGGRLLNPAGSRDGEDADASRGARIVLRLDHDLERRSRKRKPEQRSLIFL